MEVLAALPTFFMNTAFFFSGRSYFKVKGIYKGYNSVINSWFMVLDFIQFSLNVAAVSAINYLPQDWYMFLVWTANFCFE